MYISLYHLPICLTDDEVPSLQISLTRLPVHLSVTLFIFKRTVSLF